MVRAPFTSSGVKLSPHFFLGKPAKGFSGVHFLEEGLAVGVASARKRLSILFTEKLSKAIASQTKRIRTAPNIGAGINIAIINVTAVQQAMITMDFNGIRIFLKP